MGGLSLSGPASAQAPNCFGQPATIIAKPGGVTNGTSKGDVIIGSPGDDEINGRGGPDVICGRGGNDRIRGGNGRDTINGGAGADVIWGGKRGDSIMGATGADRIHGGRGRDNLAGGKGDDIIHGGRNNDRLLGKGGADELRGGPGDDELHGAPASTCAVAGWAPIACLPATRHCPLRPLNHNQSLNRNRFRWPTGCRQDSHTHVPWMLWASSRAGATMVRGSHRRPTTRFCRSVTGTCTPAASPATGR